LGRNNKQKNIELQLLPSLQYSCDLTEVIMDLKINGSENNTQNITRT